MHSPKDTTWLAHCFPCHRGLGKARQREQKDDPPLRLRDAEDETTGEGSSVRRDVASIHPWAVELLRAVKKRGEHTNVESASGQLEKQASQSRAQSGRFSLFRWRTSAVG